jgi:hypothetical protein
MWVNASASWFAATLICCLKLDTGIGARQIITDINETLQFAGAARCIRHVLVWAPGAAYASIGILSSMPCVSARATALQRSSCGLRVRSSVLAWLRKQCCCGELRLTSKPSCLVVTEEAVNACAYSSEIDGEILPVKKASATLALPCMPWKFWSPSCIAGLR